MNLEPGGLSISLLWFGVSLVAACFRWWLRCLLAIRYPGLPWHLAWPDGNQNHSVTQVGRNVRRSLVQSKASSELRSGGTGIYAGVPWETTQDGVTAQIPWAAYSAAWLSVQWKLENPHCLVCLMCTTTNSLAPTFQLSPCRPSNLLPEEDPVPQPLRGQVFLSWL